MIIEVHRLSKQYGANYALQGIDLSIEQGSVVGLLGPNGAGKTTLVETLEGIRSPTSGQVRVLGLDPTREATPLKERIGVQLQSTALPEDLTPLETLRIFAAFFSTSLPPIEVLRRVGLAGKANVTNRRMSGGERQRLAIGLALINDPELIILDEPTSGLDPEGRREILSHIAKLRTAKRTILLTTHYLEESERLCDRILILRAGQLVADGSPAELVSRTSAAPRLYITLKGVFDPAPLLQAAAEIQEGDDGHVRVAAPNPRSAIPALAQVLQNPNVALLDLRMDRPKLEDFYHTLMGGPDTQED